MVPIYAQIANRSAETKFYALNKDGFHEWTQDQLKADPNLAIPSGPDALKKWKIEQKKKRELLNTAIENVESVDSGKRKASASPAESDDGSKPAAKKAATSKSEAPNPQLQNNANH